MPLLQRLVFENRQTALVASYQIRRREFVCSAQIPGPHERPRDFQNVGSAIVLHAGAAVKTVPVCLPVYLPVDIEVSIVAGPRENAGIAA